MSKAESKYRINFEYLEDTLFFLGKDYLKELKIFEEPIDYSLRSKPIITHFARIENLEKIISALSIIEKEVNKKTKVIIQKLYYEGESFERTSKILNLKENKLIQQHKFIVDELMELIGLNTDGKRKYKKNNRYIPINIKQKVYDKCKGRCKKCGSQNNLQYHHKNRFSNGGSNEADNLTLLCLSCHANEHRNEKVFNLMNSRI